MSATRTITVKSLETLKAGSSSGKAWTLRGVKAVDAHWHPIDVELRTFENLPIGEPIDVEVESRDHPKFGRSYLLRQVKR